jgi:hypothetical protein
MVLQTTVASLPGLRRDHGAERNLLQVPQLRGDKRLLVKGAPFFRSLHYRLLRSIASPGRKVKTTQTDNLHRKPA